jgi:hypothetical protein
MKPVNLYSKLSIAFSATALMGLTALNIYLAYRYMHCDGKTRALFGIIELVHLPYKYAIGAVTVIAISLAFAATKKNESKSFINAVWLFSVLTSVLIFVRFWKLFI